MQVLREVGEGRAAAGVLPLPQQDDAHPWWPMLLAREADALRVIARLPFVPGALTHTTQEALVIGRAPTESSGSDRSLVVLELSEQVSRATVRRRIEAAGFDCRFLQLGLQQGGERWLSLVDVDGIGASVDERVPKLSGALGPKALHLPSVGSPSVPLALAELGVAGGQEAAQ